MLKIRVGTLQFTLPNSWDEITVGQFLSLQASNDPRETLIILSNKTETDLQILGDVDENSVIADHLGFLFNPPPFAALPLPTAISIDGKSINVEDLSQGITFGQWSDVDTVMGQFPDGYEISFFDMALPLLVNFLSIKVSNQPHESYEPDGEVSKAIWTMPCTQAVPMVIYFWEYYGKPSTAGQVVIVSQSRPKPETPKWPALIGRSLIRSIFRRV